MSRTLAAVTSLRACSLDPFSASPAGGAGRLPTLFRDRLLTAAALLALPVALLTYGTLRVPVRDGVLVRAQTSGHWPVVALIALLVAAGDAVWIGILVRRRGTRPLSAEATPPSTSDTAADHRRWAALAVLRPELVPIRVILIATATSLALLTVAAVEDFPLWAIAVLAIAPWVPVLAVEGIGKYQQYGLYAVFGAVTLLQVGHLGEHTAQVTQLLIADGDLSRAHGVLGQLDFETVHFVWDTGIWLGLGLLLYRFGTRSPWLWIAFAAASLHEVEHIYLFSMYRSDLAFYVRGGYAGVMGSGGVIGSPLGRPYLHFAYNVCVVLPMVIAFWDQTKRVFAARVAPAGIEPALPA